MGISLGVLFGPFAFFFWRIFPEIRNSKEISSAIFRGVLWGNLIFFSLSSFFLKYYIDAIPYTVPIHHLIDGVWERP